MFLTFGFLSLGQFAVKSSGKLVATSQKCGWSSTSDEPHYQPVTVANAQHGTIFVAAILVSAVATGAT